MNRGHLSAPGASLIAARPERRYVLRFLDSASFKPYGDDVVAELRLTVASRQKTRTIDKLLGEGWGLNSVERAS